MEDMKYQLREVLAVRRQYLTLPEEGEGRPPVSGEGEPG